MSEKILNQNEDWAEVERLKAIAIDLHWMARRYADGRASYATSLFNNHVRALMAMGVKLNITGDGTPWARDADGRGCDHLTDEEARMGNPPDWLHDGLERRAEKAEADVERLRQAMGDLLLIIENINGEHVNWPDGWECKYDKANEIVVKARKEE